MWYLCDRLPMPRRDQTNTWLILSQTNSDMVLDFAIFKVTHAPVFKKEDLFNFAMTDAASLHSLLVHSALNLRSQRNPSPDADMLYHQGESIRLINDRLGDPCHRVATDATIFTVCNMAHLEVGLPLFFSLSFADQTADSFVSLDSVRRVRRH